MRPRIRLHFAFALLLAAPLLMPLARAAADDSRFSTTINSADRATAGFSKLSSDQVAVIDALVRRDTARVAANAASRTSEAGATFSQRLNADERRAAGLALLAPAELAQLDALIERQQTARLARTLLAPPTFLTSPQRIVATEKKTEREIHGSFSLSYGVGSGGYSEKSGSMNFVFEDPARNLTINFGYSETHTKGGRGYYRDIPYALPRATTPDLPQRP